MNNIFASKKVFVSYIIVAIYFAAVFLITLLVALLASLAGVKRGNCDEISAKLAPEINKIANENNLFHEESQRRKRNIEKPSINSEFIKKKLNGKTPLVKSNCQDFMISQNGTLWENIRLPSYIRPTRYDIEIALPTLVSETYAGVVNIQIELDQDTKYILFHSSSVEFIDGELFDKSNNRLKIECGGYYVYNDYFVIITENVIPKSASPLNLNILFEGLMFRSDKGLFDVSYTDGQSRYSIIIFFFYAL